MKKKIWFSILTKYGEEITLTGERWEECWEIPQVGDLFSISEAVEWESEEVKSRLEKVQGREDWKVWEVENATYLVFKRHIVKGAVFLSCIPICKEYEERVREDILKKITPAF